MTQNFSALPVFFPSTFIFSLHFYIFHPLVYLDRTRSTSHIKKKKKNATKLSYGKNHIRQSFLLQKFTRRIFLQQKCLWRMFLEPLLMPTWTVFNSTDFQHHRNYIPKAWTFDDAWTIYTCTHKFFMYVSLNKNSAF